MGPGEFLSALFPDKASTLWVLVWQLANRKSFWSQDVAAAAKKALSLKNDVYVGCALSSENRGEGARGAAATTAGIGALWADVDFAGPDHGKPNLPPAISDACDLLAAMPLRPSLVLHTGHGLQAWWFLKDIWIFSDATDRARAASLTRGWVDVLQSHATARGWVVDAVGDLARILRLPGTVNAKSAPHKKVVVLDTDERLAPDVDRRYLIDDFEAFVTASGVLFSGGNKSPGAGSPAFDHIKIVLDPDMHAPKKHFDALLANDARFAITWAHKRRDFGKDSSASVYDMSLASMAANAGWSDQHICNLLLSFRRQHGLPMKLDNLQYYQRTIAQARVDKKSDAAEDAIDTLAQSHGAALTGSGADGEPASSADPDAPAVDKRAEALDALSVAFGVRVIRITKLLASEPEYKIETERGSVHIGPTKNLTSQTTMRNAIAAAAKFYPALRTPARWQKTVQVMLDVCEEESLGAEATDEGQAAAWLAGYFENNEPSDNEDESIKAKHPFTKDGRIHFFLSSIRHWIRTSPNGEAILSAKELGRKLRTIGCAPAVIGYKGSTRSVWTCDVEIAEKLTDKNETDRRAAAH